MPLTGWAMGASRTDRTSASTGYALMNLTLGFAAAVRSGSGIVAGRHLPGDGIEDVAFTHDDLVHPH